MRFIHELRQIIDEFVLKAKKDKNETEAKMMALVDDYCKKMERDGDRELTLAECFEVMLFYPRYSSSANQIYFYSNFNSALPRFFGSELVNLFKRMTSVTKIPSMFLTGEMVEILSGFPDQAGNLSAVLPALVVLRGTPLLTEENIDFLCRFPKQAENLAVALVILERAKLLSPERKTLLAKCSVSSQVFAEGLVVLQREQLLNAENVAILFEYPQWAKVLAMALMVLRRVHLPALIRERVLQQSEHALVVAEALFMLQRENLLIAENIEILFNQTPHVKAAAKALIVLQQGSLLVPSNLELVLKYHEYAEVLAETLVVLDKERLLTAENLSILSEPHGHTEGMGRALLILKKEHLLIAENIQVVLRYYEFAPLLALGLQTLNRAHLLGESTTEILLRYPELADVIAQALVLLHAARILTQGNINALLEHRSNLRDMVEILLRLARFHLLTSENFAMVCANAMRLPEIMPGFLQIQHAGLLNQDNLQKLFTVGRLNTPKAMAQLVGVSLHLDRWCSHRLSTMKKVGLVKGCHEDYFLDVTRSFIILQSERLLDENCVNAVLSYRGEDVYRLAQALVILNRVQLLAPENINLVLKHREYPEYFAQALASTKQSLLTLDFTMPELASAEEISGHEIAKVLTILVRSQLLTYENIVHIFGCIPYLENIISVFEKLERNGLLTAENIDRVYQHAQYADGILQAFIRNDLVIIPNYVDIIFNYPQHSDTISRAFAMLHNEGMLTAENIVELLRYPEQSIHLAAAIMFLEYACLLIGENRERLFYSAQRADEVMQVFTRLEESRSLTYDSVAEVLQRVAARVKVDADSAMPVVDSGAIPDRLESMAVARCEVVVSEAKHIVVPSLPRKKFVILACDCLRQAGVLDPFTEELVKNYPERAEIIAFVMLKLKKYHLIENKYLTMIALYPMHIEPIVNLFVESYLGMADDFVSLRVVQELIHITDVIAASILIEPRVPKFATVRYPENFHNLEFYVANTPLEKPLFDITAEAKASIDGLTDIPILGDGHCLYRAITLYLGHGEDVGFLRNIVATELEHNLEQYREFIVLPRGRTIRQYITDVRGSNAWADDLEIKILMRILGRPIVVIGMDGNIRNRVEIDGVHGVPIFVRYNDIDHYDALILTEGADAIEVLTQLLERPRPERRANLMLKSDVGVSVGLGLMGELSSGMKVISTDQLMKFANEINTGPLFSTSPFRNRPGSLGFYFTKLFAKNLLYPAVKNFLLRHQACAKDLTTVILVLHSTGAIAKHIKLEELFKIMDEHDIERYALSITTAIELLKLAGVPMFSKNVPCWPSKDRVEEGDIVRAILTYPDEAEVMTLAYIKLHRAGLLRSVGNCTRFVIDTRKDPCLSRFVNAIIILRRASMYDALNIIHGDPKNAEKIAYALVRLAEYINYRDVLSILRQTPKALDEMLAACEQLSQLKIVDREFLTSVCRHPAEIRLIIEGLLALDSVELLTQENLDLLSRDFSRMMGLSRIIQLLNRGNVFSRVNVISVLSHLEIIAQIVRLLEILAGRELLVAKNVDFVFSHFEFFGQLLDITETLQITHVLHQDLLYFLYLHLGKLKIIDREFLTLVCQHPAEIKLIIEGLLALDSVELLTQENLVLLSRDFSRMMDLSRIIQLLNRGNVFSRANVISVLTHLEIVTPIMRLLEILVGGELLVARNIDFVFSHFECFGQLLDIAEILQITHVLHQDLLDFFYLHFAEFSDRLDGFVTRLRDAQRSHRLVTREHFFAILEDLLPDSVMRREIRMVGNDGQNVHASTLGIAGRKAILSLQRHYPDIDIGTELRVIRRDLFRLSLASRRSGALAGIDRIERDNGSFSGVEVSLSHVLALVWRAANDVTAIPDHAGAIDVKRYVALRVSAVVDRLYEIGTHSICLVGTMMRILDAINHAHPDVELVYDSAAALTAVTEDAMAMAFQEFNHQSVREQRRILLSWDETGASSPAARFKIAAARAVSEELRTVYLLPEARIREIVSAFDYLPRPPVSRNLDRLIAEILAVPDDSTNQDRQAMLDRLKAMARDAYIERDRNFEDEYQALLTAKEQFDKCAASGSFVTFATILSSHSLFRVNPAVVEGGSSSLMASASPPPPPVVTMEQRPAGHLHTEVNGRKERSQCVLL